MECKFLICRLPVLKSLIEIIKIRSELSVRLLPSAAVTRYNDFPVSVLKISFHEKTTVYPSAALKIHRDFYFFQNCQQLHPLDIPVFFFEFAPMIGHFEIAQVGLITAPGNFFKRDRKKTVSHPENSD